MASVLARALYKPTLCHLLMASYCVTCHFSASAHGIIGALWTLVGGLSTVIVKPQDDRVFMSCEGASGAVTAHHLGTKSLMHQGDKKAKSCT